MMVKTKSKDENIDEVARRQRARFLDIAVEEAGKSKVGMGDDDKFNLEVISIDSAIGFPGVDEILGGGLQRGRIGLVVGEASMGKTLFTQWVIIAFQKLGYNCGFIDPEKAFNADWFSRTGVDVSKLIVVRPGSTEEAFDIASKWSIADMDLIVMDSLAALTPQARADSDLADKQFMGNAPKAISEGLNLLNRHNVNSLILCTNQMRSKIGIVYGSPDEIPGGKAQKFYSSYMIRVSRGGWIKDGTGTDAPRVGVKVKLYTEKCRFAPPFQSIEVPFMFTGLVDSTAGVVDLAIELELIIRGGAYYTWKDIKVRGMAALKEFFANNPEEMEELKALIIEGDGLPEFGEAVDGAI